MQVVTVATDKACAAGFDRAKEFLQSRLYGNHRQRIPGIGSYTHTHTHTHTVMIVFAHSYSALSLHAKKYKSQPARNFHHSQKGY